MIKYDLLLQLLSKGCLKIDNISKSDLYLWYAVFNGKDIINQILQFAILVGFNPVVASFFQGVKNLKEALQNDFNTFESEGNQEKLLEIFITKIKNNEIYECDPITNIIKKSINEIQEEGKKVIWIIEDLDRIDPAHFFRILNILSSHMDHVNPLLPFSSEANKNKFDFDNVVLVLDAENLERIFHHFYGPEANYSGYISKFLSSQPFYYSLREIREKYILDKIQDLTNMPIDDLRVIFPLSLLTENSLREIIHSFELENQILTLPEYVYKLNLSIIGLKFIAILRRLGKDDSFIIKYVCELKGSAPNLFIKYILSYVFLDYIGKIREDNFYNFLIQYPNDKSNIRGRIDVKLTHEGFGEVLNYNEFLRQKPVVFEPVVKRMLEFIA